jgi:DNA polymerase II small subunit/DNA polymerase delta subunit B
LRSRFFQKNKLKKTTSEKEKKMKFKNIQEYEKYCEENGIDTQQNIEVIFNPKTDYVEHEIINPENDQKLELTLIPAEDVEYEEAKKQLTLTTQYHDWSDTVADRLDALQRKIENEENPDPDDLAELQKLQEKIKKLEMIVQSEVSIDFSS